MHRNLCFIMGREKPWFGASKQPFSNLLFHKTVLKILFIRYLHTSKCEMRRTFLRTPGSPQASVTVETPAHYAPTPLLQICSIFPRW